MWSERERDLFEELAHVIVGVENLKTIGKLCMFVCSIASLCDPHGLQPARLLCPWKLSGKNTGVGCHLLLQGIFLTQGLNLRLLHLQADS